MLTRAQDTHQTVPQECKEARGCPHMVPFLRWLGTPSLMAAVPTATSDLRRSHHEGLQGRWASPHWFPLVMVKGVSPGSRRCRFIHTKAYEPCVFLAPVPEGTSQRAEGSPRPSPQVTLGFFCALSPVHPLGFHRRRTGMGGSLMSLLGKAWGWL